MRAVRWHGRRDVRFEDVPEPGSPGPREALIDVAYCGLCGSDFHEYIAGPVMIPKGEDGRAAPRVLGHEFCGRVRALGLPVGEIAVGQRVVVDPCWRCGECEWCVRGKYDLCRKGGAVGIVSDGALAASVLVPIEGLVAVPDHVADEDAALTEPLAVALNSLDRSRLAAGERMLVVGCGPVGLAVVMLARLRGAAEIFVSEPDAARRARAVSLGATAAFDPGNTDVRAEVYSACGRSGADVVVECTGVPSATRLAIESAAREGRVVLVGVGHQDIEVDPRSIVLYQREVIGSLGYRHHLSRVMRLLAAEVIDPRPLISTILPLSAAPEIFEHHARGDLNEAKILIRIAGGDA